jgi:hypothetical protein
MQRDRKDAAVADSAAMGLHWIYDTARLEEVGGSAPEFHKPDPKNYEGVVGVFAHAGHAIGETTRCGATVELVAKQMAADGGRFRAPKVSDRFVEAFGYGGRFIGYVDHPAAGALDGIRNRDAAIERSFLGLTGTIPFHAIMMVGPIVKEIACETDISDAAERIRVGISRFPDIELTAEAVEEIVVKTAEVHAAYWAPTGVSDLQLPVLAPVIPVALAQSIRGARDEEYAAAIRLAANLTHTDDDALAAAEFVGFLVQDLLSGIPLAHSIDSRCELLPTEIASRVRGAVSRKWDTTIAAAHELGISCALAEGLPLSLVTLLRANSYADAVRTTILCGGDSCGRGLLVGALAGLIWGTEAEKGIPRAWIAQVKGSNELEASAVSIVG